MQNIENIAKSWEEERKANLVALGKSDKPYSECLIFLQNDIETSERMTDFIYKIPCFFNDGVYQLNRAIEENVGATSIQREKTPSSERPLKTVDIVLANGVRKKVPFGDIDLPNMGEGANIQIYYSNEGNYLSVKGMCQFKFHGLIDAIISRTIQLLNTDSIYKSQAIEINKDVNKGQPTILDISNVDKEVMILSAKTEYELSPLYSRILQPEKCIENNISIKFGAILEGPYGTGKTLLAFKLAKTAIQNNWSFIYLKSPEFLADTLRMAKTLDRNGNGIIIFTEDIDQVTRGERTAALQDILNTLDGGDTKGMNVISLFTTNHIELIEPTFLRGKRIGSLISLGFLTEETCAAYIEKFCEGITLEGDFNAVHKMVAQNNIAPAFMAEIIENVKSNMILRDDKTVTADQFITCIESYLRQVSLSKTKDTSKTKEMVLAEALSAVVNNESNYERIESIVKEVLEN